MCGNKGKQLSRRKTANTLSTYRHVHQKPINEAYASTSLACAHARGCNPTTAGMSRCLEAPASQHSCQRQRRTCRRAMRIHRSSPRWRRALAHILWAALLPTPYGGRSRHVACVHILREAQLLHREVRRCLHQGLQVERVMPDVRGVLADRTSKYKSSSKPRNRAPGRGHCKGRAAIHRCGTLLRCKGLPLSRHRHNNAALDPPVILTRPCCSEYSNLPTPDLVAQSAAAFRSADDARETRPLGCQSCVLSSVSVQRQQPMCV